MGLSGMKKKFVKKKKGSADNWFHPVAKERTAAPSSLETDVIRHTLA